MLGLGRMDLTPRLTARVGGLSPALMPGPGAFASACTPSCCTACTARCALLRLHLVAVQALSHLVLDTLQMGSTLAILWACLRRHRQQVNYEGHRKLHAGSSASCRVLSSLLLAFEDRIERTGGPRASGRVRRLTHFIAMCLQPRQDGWFRMALRPPQQWLLPTALACLLFPAVNALTAVTQVSCTAPLQH